MQHLSGFWSHAAVSTTGRTTPAREYPMAGPDLTATASGGGTSPPNGRQECPEDLGGRAGGNRPARDLWGGGEDYRTAPIRYRPPSPQQNS
ncbi:hypothetical protein Pta02_14420 [Planobispora takensis]|uniref:Uncharacterized protein n=1 Tax=Planobispora takensis TaxID=1367882 RepID=A0A8J3T1N9_9ACTN|nr:hypothetical protein Pta02_14420 [Planobispora takensis]